MVPSERQLTSRLSFNKNAAAWAGMIDDYVKAARKKGVVILTFSGTGLGPSA
jgi:hypothetical protein